MENLQPRTFADFERETSRGNVVPVVRTVHTDSRTPVDVFLRVAGDAHHGFILESVEGAERSAQYSFVGAEPDMIMRGHGNQTIIERNGKSELLDMRATAFVREYLGGKRLAHRANLAPLAGGAVGYFGYGAAHWFDPALESKTDAQEVDDAILMFYRTILAFDRARRQLFLTSVVFADEAEGDRERLRDLYDHAVEETSRLERLLRDGDTGNETEYDQLNESQADSSFTSNWTQAGFQDAVRLIKEHIAAGDCFQVVLSQRFTKTVNAPPIEIYRALRVVNPSPYMYFLRLGDESIVGASPEMLVRCRGSRLDYRPIAGTRKRGTTTEEDRLLADEMRNDEKEVAEHMMLVDLGRNDLGRVANYGSVQVEDLMEVECYSHVQHLVSSLRAQLKRGLNRFDALAACFPAGTVTGAPKVRAMETIRDLEPDARGVYAGAIVYADYSDNLDSCIAIRTMVVREGKATVQAGAGIVADSVPELEYQETINKAKALFRAIALAEASCNNL